MASSNTTVEQIVAALSRGETVNAPGLGKFSVVDKAAYTGRNPATGAPIAVPAKKKISFKPSPTFSNKLNGGA